MLYQNHPPLFFQIHTVSPISHSSAHTTRPLSSSPSLIQAETKMECVEAALKASFRKEMAMKSNSQRLLLDDLWAVNGQNGASCDDFSVDDLLDFSDGDGLVEERPEEVEDKGFVSVFPTEELLENHTSNRSTSFYAIDESGSVPSSELAVPADDLADLEWLSHFVEDSFLEYAAPFPTGTLPEKPKNNTETLSELETPASAKPCFKTPVPAKARSKRTRTGGRVWSLGSPSLSESSSSSTTTSSSCSSPSSPWLIYTKPGPNLFSSLEKQPVKKAKKKAVAEGTVIGGAQTPRRCSHCGVQKTPQWRSGPLGAKTLCNACGVRYKSGRLLPEYRPACSPTFSSELHSNHHRKVLEMRRKKEVLGHPGSGLAPPVVPSF